jgi:LuxR family maltose regulon positive regulatory protein
MTSDTLLSTKLLIPPARANMVARPRLIDRLGEGLRLGRRLTLVSAPPGFGKTSLIREWVAATQWRVAWLSIDEGDNDEARFLRYVSAALGQADERIGLPAQASSPPASPQELLIALINNLAHTTTEVLLVLDDYHLISEFAVHDLVAFLLSNQPLRFHLVIGTREDPPLPLARLRSRDQLTEIRERTLRFTPEEAAAFLSQTMNLGLSPASVASLTARTEGWITGLQLAGLALRQLAAQVGPLAPGQRLQSAADDFVAAFAGDDRYIVDYLMAEVLDHEPEHVRSFLRQTSILDRLSAPLCDALTGQDDSQAMLEHLEGANLFLILLDNRREWFRYHVLFAEVLRLTLTAQESVELHKKAATWFAAHGLDELARHHTRMAAQTLATSAATRKGSMVDQPLIEPLSERELEVLRLIADGLSNAEIAAKLIIAHGTVKRHTNNIYGKLGVQSRTQAVARSRDLGLL